MFQDLLDAKWTGKKMHNKYFTGRSWEKEPEERSHEGRMGMPHAANEYGHVGPNRHLGPCFDLPL
jgi:hypothetical protein